MRTFIVSDLHGNGEVYKTIMAYLENVNKEDKVKLYINGDLIDRGIDSFTMLNDIIDRINDKNYFEIEYLGGNHELMMWDAIRNRNPRVGVTRYSDWLNGNGGNIINNEIVNSNNREELYEKYLEFSGNLNIYHLFDEKIKGNRLLLVHASAPKKIRDVCDMKIKDNTWNVFKAVWDREENDYFPFVRNKLGKDGYLTIIGHTIVEKFPGFIYNREENCFNIDGGCSAYALGYFNYNHVPLVEVEDGLLTFIIFNHNNEIIDGYTYSSELVKLSDEELDKRRKYINHEYDNCEIINQELIKKRRWFH